MQRRSVLATLVALGTSGCLRLTESQSAESTTTTLTTDQSYPNGITEDGVASYFHNTHLRNLGQNSFSTQWSIINQGKGEVDYRRQYTVGESIASGSWTYDTGKEIQAYQTDTSGFWREDVDDGYTYGKLRHGYSLEEYALSSWLSPFISGGKWSSPVVVQSDSPAKWELDLTGAGENVSVPGWFTGTVESFSGTMVVDEQGLIRSFDAEMEASGTNTGQVQYRTKYNVDSVGDAAPEKPGWLTTAKAERPRVSISRTEDQRFIRLTVDTGVPIEPDTRLVVYDTERQQNVMVFRLGSQLGPGETVYLFKETPDENGTIRRGSRPSGVSPVTLDNSYRVWAQRNHAEYFATVTI